MATFDVVSEVDMQEVRNAVDQAAREVAQRFDFKGTDSSIELGDDEIKMASSSEDRLAALRVVVEEKFARRKISMKVLDYGTVEPASGGAVRQVARLQAGISSVFRHLSSCSSSSSSFAPRSTFPFGPNPLLAPGPGGASRPSQSTVASAPTRITFPAALPSRNKLLIFLYVFS